jgi:hypothetical protein
MMLDYTGFPAQDALVPRGSTGASSPEIRRASMPETKTSKEIAPLLWSLERMLLDPAVRCDPAQVSALLADDFVEFGASGQIWTRDQIIAMLAGEGRVWLPPSMEDFHCRLIGRTGAALVTYRAVRTDTATGSRTVSLRSSLWSRESGTWKILFHQGTGTN